jgi:hypothetical protein
MAKNPLDNVLSSWHQLIENCEASTELFYASVENALKQRKIPELKTKRITWNEGGVLCPKRKYLRMTDGRITFDLCAAPFGTGFFLSWWLAKKPASWVAAWTILFAAAAVLVHGWLRDGLFATYSLFPNAGVWQSWMFWRPSLLAGWFRGTGLPVGLILWLVAVLIVFLVVALASRMGRVAAGEAMLAIPVARIGYRRLFAPVTYYRLDTAIMFRTAVQAAVLEAVDHLTTTKGLRALSEDERKPVMKELLSSTPPRELLPLGVAEQNKLEQVTRSWPGALAHD